ncbi:DUF3887 domain-containing protein [Streptomyces sp. NPDC002138]|uniref:DUF3887 domain-containing protein n=1 Tax=Streptomyces sp. NPDC002138 TaxID=3154410 RepID=UPI003319A0E8
MEVSGPAKLEKVVVLMPDKDTTLGSKRQLVQAVATVALTACVLLPANGFAQAAIPARATTTVAEQTAAIPDQTRYDQIALQTLDAIVSGDYAAATAHFDTNMRKLLTPDALGGAWAAYQAKFGSYQSHGDPKDVLFGEFTVVNVPLTMEHQPGEFRVTLHMDGSIAGLQFLQTGVPIS